MDQCLLLGCDSGSHSELSLEAKAEIYIAKSETNPTREIQIPETLSRYGKPF